MPLNLEVWKKPIAAVSVAASLGLGGAWTLVDHWEGNRLTGYKDSIGIPTICRGTTSGPLVKRGTATQEECDGQTLADLKVAYATVKSCVSAPLTEGETAAWVSFTLNVGPGRKGVKDGMCVLKSGALPGHVTLLSQGKHREACNKLMEWTRAGGQVVRGLYNRRLDETAICLRDLP